MDHNQPLLWKFIKGNIEVDHNYRTPKMVDHKYLQSASFCGAEGWVDHNDTEA